MDRSAFERAFVLGQNERMPCVSPVGYTAGKMSVRENMMRKAVRADRRDSFESIFFDSTFNVPLTKEAAGWRSHWKWYAGIHLQSTSSHGGLY